MTVRIGTRASPLPELVDALIRILTFRKAVRCLDGAADKTVVRCAGCVLGMDGVADHSLEAHGYTLYFCRAGCAQRFGKDIKASILAMEIPED